jgi:hypothetical protein
MDDSSPAHLESPLTSKICNASWLMVNNSVSFFGFHPSPDIKHILIESANAILQKKIPRGKKHCGARFRR